MYRSVLRVGLVRNARNALRRCLGDVVRGLAELSLDAGRKDHSGHCRESNPLGDHPTRWRIEMTIPGHHESLTANSIQTVAFTAPHDREFRSRKSQESASQGGATSTHEQEWVAVTTPTDQVHD
jgi:hypothetical protein